MLLVRIKYFEIRNYAIVFSYRCSSFTVASLADRLEFINFLNIKTRRHLKGHQSKVLCCDWCSDKRRLVSTAQVNSRSATRCFGNPFVLSLFFFRTEKLQYGTRLRIPKSSLYLVSPHGLWRVLTLLRRLWLLVGQWITRGGSWVLNF